MYKIRTVIKGDTWYQRSTKKICSRNKVSHTISRPSMHIYSVPVASDHPGRTMGKETVDLVLVIPWVALPALPIDGPLGRRYFLCPLPAQPVDDLEVADKKLGSNGASWPRTLPLPPSWPNSLSGNYRWWRHLDFSCLFPACSKIAEWYCMAWSCMFIYYPPCHRAKSNLLY